MLSTEEIPSEIDQYGPGDTSPTPPLHERFEDALPSPEKIAAVRERLEAAGVKYVMSCWIDLFGIPKTKPVPMSDFEALCAGKGPQFAVHSISRN
jgi:glutamine synthetase